MEEKTNGRAANDPLPTSQISRRDFLTDAALVALALPATSSARRPLAAGLARDPQSAAHADVQGSSLRLTNGIIAAQWKISPTSLEFLSATDLRSGQVLAGPRPVFALALRDSTEIASTSIRLVGSPRRETLSPSPQAARWSDRLGGCAVAASLEDRQGRVRLEWRAMLRDGSHYIRQELAIRPLEHDLPIAKINLLDLRASDAEIMGTVKGSPVRSPGWFFGFEHPLSESVIESDRVRSRLDRQLPLSARQLATYSCVIGASQAGQLRRDFLGYIERERAHPYRTFLHYNSWFDLGYFTPYNQSQAVDAINAFGTELHEKRGVTLDSFLFDDGWDDHRSLWRFNPGFPDGFVPIRHAAATYRAAPGIWLSPWGGYDGPRNERLAYGKQHGYEENSEGFVLSGPRYFGEFREICLRMIGECGVNQFKFDGTGNASTVYPGSQFNSDFEAMISLIGDLRAAKPDLYVNLTTGTYPSPFWLQHADSIWRGGEDDSFSGLGTDRQQWITYRDASTHEYVVRRGPLYPLNSLMLHGLIFARDAEKLSTDPARDFPSEVRSYFGTGTQLQEMYITHALLSASDWDLLAETAKWSRRNSDILVDTHWIGGDPAKLEVYGWASWSPRGGILTLRNPDKVPHRFDLDLASAFELPSGAARNYVARSPWKQDQAVRELDLTAGQSRALSLQPFEVLTLEAAPR
ncbi:MAG TPA: enterotoxin [Candidatus Cybelea sp.]|nr:enterotoxin [Candidatus Cybelea sp.]